MTKQELLDFSADQIGKPWTVESHQTLVAGLRAIEKLAEHVRVVRYTAGLPHFDVPLPEATRYHHSPVDPEAAEI